MYPTSHFYSAETLLSGTVEAGYFTESQISGRGLDRARQETISVFSHAGEKGKW
jgi:hypothetical protein